MCRGSEEERDKKKSMTHKEKLFPAQSRSLLIPAVESYNHPFESHLQSSLTLMNSSEAER